MKNSLCRYLVSFVLNSFWCLHGYLFTVQFFPVNYCSDLLYTVFCCCYFGRFSFIIVDYISFFCDENLFLSFCYIWYAVFRLCLFMIKDRFFVIIVVGFIFHIFMLISRVFFDSLFSSILFLTPLTWLMLFLLLLVIHWSVTK